MVVSIEVEVASTTVVVVAQLSVKCVLSIITLLSHVTITLILSIKPPTMETMAMVIVLTGLKTRIRIGTTPLVPIGTLNSKIRIGTTPLVLIGTHSSKII